MEKLLAIILCLIMCFGLCACGRSSNSDNEDNPSSISSKKDYSSTASNYETDEDTHTHTYSSASCTSPSRCSCGATQGSALGHNYSKATCTVAAKCSRCGTVNGNAAGHKFSSGKCSVCGVKDPNALPSDMRQTIITNLDYAVSDLETSWQAYKDYKRGGILSDEYYDLSVTLAKRAGNYVGIAHTLALSYPKAKMSDGHYVVDDLSILKQVIDLLAMGPVDESYTKVVDFSKEVRQCI